MANDTISLLELLRKVGMDKDTDFLREGVKTLSQAIIELEAAEKIGAGYYERSASRLTHRNGYREREWDTRVGAIPLRIPKIRQGSFFPSLLEPRRRAERALVAVIQEAYVHGVSTRKVGSRPGPGPERGVEKRSLAARSTSRKRFLANKGQPWSLPT